MSTEKKAVMTMIELIESAPHLEADLDWNDRTPLTDGHIELYRSEGRSLKNRVGRVWTQVKGREKGKVGKKTYSLTRADFEGHLANDGVVFFCVDVGANERLLPTWYAVLTPFDLRRILDDMKPKQKTASFPLKRMHRTPEEVSRIVEVAWRARRQDPLRQLDPNIFNEIRELKITSVEPINLDRPVELNPRDSTFVAEVVTHSGSNVPLDGALKIIPGDYVEHTRSLRIAAGAIAFEPIIAQRLGDDELKLTLCDGLSLVITADERRTINVNIEFQANFRDRKRSLEFMVALADTRQLQIGEGSVSLDQLPAAKSPQVGEMRSHLAFLRDLQQVFDKFEVDTTLVDVESFTDEDLRNLQALYEIFVECKPRTRSDDEQGLKYVKFGEVGVVILVMRDEEPGTWRYSDPFDPETSQPGQWVVSNADKTDAKPITVYDLVESEMLPKVLNVRADRAADAYQRISKAETTSSCANGFFRELLNYVDAGRPRRDEFLDAAEDLNEWLIGEYGEEPTHVLNRWQVAWRRESLTDTDLRAIRDLKFEASRSADKYAAEQELACALLLGDAADAEYLASRMDGEKHEQMEGWPIWELYRQLVRSADRAPSPSA